MILEFNLPEDAEEAQLYYAAPKYHYAVTEVDNWARGKLKYTSPTEKEIELLEEVRRLIRDSIADG